MTRRGAAGFLFAGPGVVFGSQANSAIRVGIVGAGGRGRFVGAIFAGDPRARVTDLCDLFDDQLERAKAQVPGAGQARTWKDYRELLARPDIDAVLIATPVFAHPEHFEAAVKAGKHIYIEKPAAADVAGVKRMLAAARAAGPSRHIVFGFHNRFSPEYRAAEAIVRSGKLGDLLLMECHFNRSGVLGQRTESKYPLAERRIRHWGAFRETSGDIIVEQDCHGLDVLNWFAGAHPLKAVGAGGRIRRAFGDNLDHLGVVYEYPGGLRGILMAAQLTPARYRDVREHFFGSAGVLETHRAYYKWYRGEGPIAKVDSRREITIDAVEDFLEKVVAGKPENTVPAGCESTFTSLLGRLAIDLRREVSWEELMKEG